MASLGQVIFWSIISIIIILAGAIAFIIGFGISVLVRLLVMKDWCKCSKAPLGVDPCFLNCRKTLDHSHHSHLGWEHWGGWDPELHFR
uniref:V-set domain containing T cell activation inhibitor 1 n=1 Tax=Catagonus wagneri TaxID=51154 RepID=A0A8C3VSD0_9CETA